MRPEEFILAALMLSLFIFILSVGLTPGKTLHSQDIEKNLQYSFEKEMSLQGCIKERTHYKCDETYMTYELWKEVKRND